GAGIAGDVANTTATTMRALKCMAIQKLKYLGCGPATLSYRVPANRRGPWDRRSPRRVVHPEHLAQRVADLAQRGPRPERLLHRVEQVAGSARRLGHPLESGFDGSLVTFGPELPDPFLLRFDLGFVDGLYLHDLLVRLGVAVDPDHGPVAVFDLTLDPVRRLVDLAFIHPASIAATDPPIPSILSTYS